MLYNLDSFLWQKPKSYFILNSVIIFLILSLIFITLFVDIYDVYSIKGTIKCQKLCTISSNVDLELVSIINNGEFLKIDKQDYSYQIKSISETNIDYINMINYQTVELETNLLKNIQKNNMIIQVLIYTNKESILRKIIKKFI